MKRLLALALLLPAVLRSQAASPFPHARHAKLFPTCSGCHAGVMSGDAARTFPSTAQCAQCHDGQRQRLVVWAPPVSRGAGLLNFSHIRHAVDAAPDATCAACHGTTGEQSPWMNVGRAAQKGCVSCHAQNAPEHYASANTCATCHRTLAEATGLSDARISALPRPASHAQQDFALAHGSAVKLGTASCATCHARESCARCHVDAGRSASIKSLAADARVARLAASRAPAYPVPPDHRADDFDRGHGASARANTARCAVCHARASCATCHTGDGAARVLAQLPDAAEARGRGVQLKLLADPGRPGVAVGRARARAWMPQPHAADSTRRVRVHAIGFARTHGPSAAAEALGCQGCHAQSFCKDCHVGEKIGRRSYHEANFMTRHASSAYGRDVECSTCHNTAAFCRSCHQQAGLASQGNGRSAGYHNAQPLWLQEHGRAARQELNSCATCHQQRYCMQCHSDLGWRISPHGPNFDAARYASRNRQQCLRCHFKDPLGGK